MPPTARKPVTAGTRRVRLALPPFLDEPGVLELWHGEKCQEYLLFVLPGGPAGRTYKLRQYAGDRPGKEYHVLLGTDPRDTACDCPDALYRGSGCKHVTALQAILARNLIP